MNRTKQSHSMNRQWTTFRAISLSKRAVAQLVASRGAALLAAVAISHMSCRLSQADTLTWTGGTGVWDTVTANWDDGGPTTYTDGGVDDVIFDGTSPGTVTIQSGGVTALSMLHSGGTHEFTGGAAGDTLTTTPITLSGGTLQYNGLGRLGTGQINVTGNATIEATSGSSAQTGLANSGIVVSDGVTLSLSQNNPGSQPTGTIAPISGGGGTPITLNINAGGGTRGYALSPGSTFIGDINLGGRTYFTTLASSMFGDLGNTINASLEARLDGGGGTVDQDINHTGGDSHWNGGPSTPLILNGQVNTIGGELTGGTIRFTNPGNSLGSWSMNQGFVLEFAHDGEIGFSNLTANGPDGAGVGKTIRWVGAGVNGLASTNWTIDTYSVTDNLTANIDVVDPTSTASWTGDWRGNDSLSTTFEKEGAGTLNWSGDSTGNEAIVINVNGGTLNINSTVSNIDSINIASGATLGGTGDVTLDSGAALITVGNGGTISPGLSEGTLTINGDLLLSSSSTSSFELSQPGVVGGLLNDLIIVDGDLTLDGILALENPSLIPAGSYRLYSYTGSLDNQGLSLVTLPSQFTLSFAPGQVNLNVTAIPEPSSFLLLGLGCCGLLVRRRCDHWQSSDSPKRKTELAGIAGSRKRPTANPAGAVPHRFQEITIMRSIVTRIASVLLFVSLLLVVGTPAADAIPLNGLIAHYRLDESSGLTASDSAGSADGTLVNFVGNEWTSGVINNALPFVRASSQYVTVNGLAGSLSTGNDYTVTAWFNTTTAGLGNNQHQIFSAHDGGGNNIFRLGTDNDGGIFLATVSGDEAIGSGFNNGAWHLTTVSRTGGSTTVTVDGTVLPGFVSGDPLWTSATQFSLGQEYDGGTPGDFFDGLLDDVTVWNRALSLSEMQEIFDNGVAGFSIEGAPIPEPSACLLVALGLPLLVRRARRGKS